MSAVTQSGIETSAERAYADLVARMRELDSSRRLRRFLIRAFFATASSILLLILFGTVDLFFQLRPAFREIFVATLLAAFLCTVGWAGLRCIRIQSLESVAREVSRFAISREN